MPSSLSRSNTSPFRITLCILPLVSIAHATDGGAIGTYVGGAFSWSSTANWTGGTVADGVGAVATFSNNYTATVQLNFGLGGGSTNITLGALNVTDTTPSSQVTIQGGSGGTANLTFDDTDNVSEINVSTSAAVPIQFGNTGSLSILGNDNLRISVTGTTSAVRFNTNVNWSGQTGKVTLASGNFQTESSNTLPGAAELELGTGVQIRALLNNGSQVRNQSLKGLSGAATSSLGTSDNATTHPTLGEAKLTLGAGTLASDGYDFAGSLGANAIITGVGQENSRFDLLKTGLGTQRFSGTNLNTGLTTIDGGTLLVNGTHNADTSTSGNLASVTTRGAYVVNSGGTLGGTGTIKPYSTANGGAIIDIASGGTLAPGDGGVGTLTLDNTGSVRSILQFSSGGLGAFDLGSAVTADKVGIAGSSSLATEVVFNNTVINFTDRTGGSLTTGDYLLFEGDANVSSATGYGGLTLGGTFNGASLSGTLVTSGLVVGTGLAAYSSAAFFLVGNDIYLNISAVPEPATTSALLGLGSLLLCTRRRQRRA